MNERPAELPAAGVVRVVGPRAAGTGFLVSDSGLIVTCAHVVAGTGPGATVSVEPHAGRRALEAVVVLLQDPPDVAVLRLAASVPPGARALPLGRSPAVFQRGLRTFGYPRFRPEAGVPGELAFQGLTADAGYDQLVLRSEEATVGFSGAPVWDPELGAVVGMVKSIAREDPGDRLRNAAIGVPAEVIRDVCPDLRLPAGCPYRALEPFTEEHADCYYGREHATSQLLASLAARDFVAVVAVSGGGKSSLLQAGLARGLRDRPVVGLAQRARCYQRVGSSPYDELLRSLARHGMILPSELAAASARELAQAVHRVVPSAGLIMVVDQFERLYTDCADAERQRFLALLQCLAAEPVKVVIGLRADFYHLALADLGERLTAGQVGLAPMTDQDLGRAIAVSAEKMLRSFQPGLAQRLIADVRGRPGDLPLLQFALTELWEHDAAGGVLTDETYRGLGAELPDGTHLPGVQGALIRRAEQLWQNLGSADQARLPRILLGLVAAQPAGTSAASLAEHPRDFSRPALLAQWDDDDQRLIQQLVDARLLTTDRAADGRATAEVSHEVLLRAWPRLRGWLDEHGKFVQWRAQDLAPNLERWLSSRKNPGGKGNPGFLLPPPLLDPALRWLHDYPEELAGPQSAYIQAGKRRRNLRRSVAGGTVALLVVASLTAAGIFFTLRQAAVHQQDIAVSRLLISESQAQADTNPLVSKLLSIAASRIYPTDNGRDAMLDAAARPEIGALTVPGGEVRSVAFSPDGKTLATADNGTVGLWDVTTQQQAGDTINVPRSTVELVAFSRDGKTLATAGNGIVQLWDVTTHQQAGSTINVPGGLFGSVAFSPDGKILAAGQLGGTVRLWDVTTHQQAGSTINVPGGGPVVSVAFSRDGKTLATGSADGTVRLWDVTTHQQTGITLSATGGTDEPMAFSLNGKILATGSADGTVRLWDVTTHQQAGITINVPGGDAVVSVAFSRDGKTLATGSADGTVQLWDVTTHQQTGNTINVPGGPVELVAFSLNGKILATGSNDGTVRLWDVTTQQTGSMTVPGGDAVESVAFSQDGKTLATGSADGTVRQWDATTRRQIGRAITVPVPDGGSEALSRDGKTVATGSADGTVQLWDVTTQQQTGSTINVPGGINFPRDVVSVALSLDGKTLAAGQVGGTVQLWDVTTRRQIGSTIYASAGPIVSVAFSRDGKTLATGSADGTVQLWNVTTRRQTGSTIYVPGGRPVVSVAFSPDGKTLATGSNGTVELWDVTTQQQTGSTIYVPGGGQVVSVAFSRDGKTLATGSADGTVRLWDVGYSTDTTSDLCASAGRSLTPAEWAQYVPGLAYRTICP